MMKKALSVLLALTMALGLAACGSSSSSSTEEASSAETEEATVEEGEEASASDSAATYKVAFILNSSINDGGWGTACYSELVAA